MAAAVKATATQTARLTHLVLITSLIRHFFSAVAYACYEAEVNLANIVFQCSLTGAKCVVHRQRAEDVPKTFKITSTPYQTVR
jgi:hypothetical protein